MQNTIKSTLKWEDAPDIIDHKDLAKIIGVCPDTAKQIFNDRKFPKIPGINKRKADKEVVRLYLQGLYSTENIRDSRQNLILVELQKINSNLSRLLKEGDTNEKT